MVRDGRFDGDHLDFVAPERRSAGTAFAAKEASRHRKRLFQPYLLVNGAHMRLASPIQRSLAAALLTTIGGAR